MNTNQGALYFGAGIDLNQWRRDIDSMRRDIVGLNNSVSRETKSIDNSFRNLAGGIAGYFSAQALMGFTQQLINVRGEFQKTEIAFSTMLGSGEKAKALMGQMVDLAAKTPFSLQDVSAGAKQLLAFQVPANEVVDTLTRMGNIAAGLGVPLSRINLVYGQVKAKGKLMGDDLRQFTEAGIPMVAELAKKFNVSTAAITEMVTAGKIGFKDVQDVLFSMTNEGGMFFNLMEKQSASLSGQWSNLMDAFDQMLNKIGQNNEGILSDGIQGLTYLVEHYQDVLDILTVLISTYGAYRAALILTSVIQKSIAFAEHARAAIQLAQGISGMTKAQLAFNVAASANPLGAIAAAIGLVVSAYIVYKDEINKAIGVTNDFILTREKYEKAVKSNLTEAGNEIAQLDKLIRVAEDEKKSRNERLKAAEKMQKMYPSYLGNLSTEAILAGKAANQYLAIKDAIIAASKARAAQGILDEKSTERLEWDNDWRKKYQDSVLRMRKAKKEGFDIAVEHEKTYQKKLIEERKKWNNENRNQDDFYLKEIEKNNAKAGKILSDREKAQDSGGGTQNGAKKGSQAWYEEQISQLEEAKKNLNPLSAEWKRINDKIEAYKKILNPKKESSSNQLPEIIPIGSIKELQRRAQLIQDAIDVAVNGQVKLRKLDKYGKDTDKNGNPYLTGQTVSVNEAKKQIEAINAQIKILQGRSFDEELTELERQWKAKYKIAEFYGKEIADAQFPALKGSYYDDIKKKYDEFSTKFESDVTLSDDDVENWEKLREILNNLTGEKDPLSNFNESMDRALAKLPSLYDQIEYLQKLRDQQGNDGVSNGFFASADNKLQEKLQEQKAVYQEFLNEAETYESKKLEIERKYDDIRKRIGNNGGLSDAERIRLLNEAGKKENEEVAKLNLDGIKKTQLWVKAFGDLSNAGTKTLKKLKQSLLDYLNANKDLSPTDVASISDQINKIDDALKNDPFQKIGVAVDNYKGKLKDLSKTEKDFGKNSPEYTAALEETENAFVGIMEAANEAAQFMTDSVVTILDSFGAISEEGKQTIKDIQSLVDGIVNAVAGYFTGNYGQMISGIVQIVVALASLLSGDVRRAKNIKEWQAQVDSLKQSYEALQYQIEKTAGEDSLQGQTQLIANLKQQQELLIQMRNAEAQKKKADAGKIGSYNDQIAAINQQIEQLVDSFKESITTTDFKQMSDDLANALIEAFGKGEDAAGAFDKVVDDVMRNAVANALKIKILQPAVESMVNQLYSSLGFGNKDTTNIQNQIADLENKIVEAQTKMATVSSIDKPRYEAYIKSYQQLIAKLKQQIAEANVSGSFDGLTDAEREAIKAQGQAAMQQYMDALKEYEDLFGSASENAQGLKGDIKGITEKTAGALEAQFNAIRINVVEILKVIKGNQTVSNNHTLLLSQIEFNTRNLIQMRKDLQELNSKTKNQLAGVP